MYDFEKVLIQPNIDPLDANTQRIRRNLMVSSIVIFIFSIASDGIDTTNTSIAGVKFINLNSEYIHYLLLSSLLYFLLHFYWAASNHLKQNYLRLTGIAIPKINEVGGFAGKHDLYANTDDAKQSTLYSWWLRLKDFPTQLQERYDKNLQKIESSDFKATNQTIESELSILMHRTSYINEALLRFDKGFWYYQRSQLLRWLLLDFGIPFLMGLIAFGTAFYKQIWP